MQDNNHKTLLGAIIIIGSIIIVILLLQRTPNRAYTYQGSTYTASAYPLAIPTQPQIGTYSFVRYIPKATNTYTTGTTYTYYTQPQTQSYDYNYQYQDNGVVFPDGCTLTSPVSTTTGQPCS